MSAYCERAMISSFVMRLAFAFVAVDDAQSVAAHGNVAEQGVGIVADSLFERVQGAVIRFFCDVVEVDQRQMCEAPDVVLAFSAFEDQATAKRGASCMYDLFPVFR